MILGGFLSGRFFILISFGCLYIAVLKAVYNKYIYKIKYNRLILILILFLTIIIAYIIQVVFSVDLLERFQAFFVMIPLSFVDNIFPDKNDNKKEINQYKTLP